MVPRSSGTFSPNPLQGLQTGVGHSHPSQAGVLSAGASPGTGSPTGTSSLSKITITQVHLLLGTIKDNKDDPTDFGNKINRLNKLINDNGMEVFTKYFTRLVISNAAQIFPGVNKANGITANPGNYPILEVEMRKISHDIDQATKIAESIEMGTEDIFRDFDLSTFMEHFRLDALEKTVLALAFKLGTRLDLKTKADAILSANFPTFISIASKPDGNHDDLSPEFLSIIIDRLIQYHPPNFNAASKNELSARIESRYSQMEPAPPPPSEVLAALDLMRVLGEKPPNALALYIQRTGAEFTRDENLCTSFLQNRPSNIQLNEEQVANALTYTTISQTPRHDPATLVAGLRNLLPPSFSWQDVVSYFDQRGARISSPQFLRLYHALLPITQGEGGANFDIQRLWGGNWNDSDTQLSFICAFASLTPNELDASTIPGLIPSFTLDSVADSPAAIRERAAYAVRHPLVSVKALSAVFHVALHSVHASQAMEAKRLFQEVVVPNLDIFVVSAFGVDKPWPPMAVDTLTSLFKEFLYKKSEHYEFVLDSLWRKDKDWVLQSLIDAHADNPVDLPLIFEHAVKHNWFDELVYLPNGLGLDLAAFAHAEAGFDLDQWARNYGGRSADLAHLILQFLRVKAHMEGIFQRPQVGGRPNVKQSTTLKVKTVYHLLTILQDFFPSAPAREFTIVQRQCITSYPRLINYGEGYDDIIDANGENGNALPPAANSKMEEHYKKMYGDEVQVREVVEALERYKHSRDPLEQDSFACMIHGLFDEYLHYVDYPLEALATTAVLFGGIISHKLVDNVPLQIGLGMILEAVRDHHPDDSMYKFGLQALIQLFGRLHEWPGFCEQLLQIPGLQNTDAWQKAEAVVRDFEEEKARTLNGGGHALHGAIGHESLTNGIVDDSTSPEQHFAPFRSINIDPHPPNVLFEDPTDDSQDKIQFALNNIDDSSLETRFNSIHETLEPKNQQWFASHLVEGRAKMQPNLQFMFLALLKLFDSSTLWAEVLRETFISVARMLNSEATMQNSTERVHLKNLAGWLGMLTLARDKPIRHRNIAFKQLLIEAHDTKRLIVVIPFVCKVLMAGATSNVFRPPNPWLMDIIHLLIELYHNAELKLNLKFEIEVLCNHLSLDHKSIEPSGEILNRVHVEEPTQLSGSDGLDTFDGLPINGIGVGGGHTVAPSIPDLGPELIIPPISEMVVSSARLHDIVRSAITRALADIIQPVVDRSVTIAAISTQQMVRKDFATEPDENRMRASAITMVKTAAGSLANVTSREPLRANFSNYLRQYSNDIAGGLPEGTIVMCVNHNIELASKVIKDAAEERAVPEIEEAMEPEFEARRRHRLSRPNEPYVDPSLSRWSWTIPNPYKLSPNVNGLNSEQMAIYEEFARQPRAIATTSTPSHVASTSDATRSMANEVLQEQYVPSIPTSAETPSMPHMAGPLQNYSHAHAGLTNGRPPAGAAQVDNRAIAEQLHKLIYELQEEAQKSDEDHYEDLPRPHEVLNKMDHLISTIIRSQPASENLAKYAVEQICGYLIGGPAPPLQDSLAIETLLHALDAVRRMGGPSVSALVKDLFRQADGQSFLRPPLISALVISGTDLLDWRAIDGALAESLHSREDKSIQLLGEILEMTVLVDGPVTFMADFGRSLDEAYAWIREEPDVSGGQQLKAMMAMTPSQPVPTRGPEDMFFTQREQMDYIFDEWVHRRRNMSVADSYAPNFVRQLHEMKIVACREDFFVFVRICLDKSVAHFEKVASSRGTIDEGYALVNALTALIGAFVKTSAEDTQLGVLETVLSLSFLILSFHHEKHKDFFNQRVFFRFYSNLLWEIDSLAETVDEAVRGRMLLAFAAQMAQLGPYQYPGFTYGWMPLINHRAFFIPMMKMEGNGWASYTKLLKQLLGWVGEQLNVLHISNMAKQLYESTLKLLLILQHDYPDYLAANHTQLVESIPTHCTQLISAVLNASPPTGNKLLDPSAPALEDTAELLREMGLLDIVDQVLENGPSENAVAHMTHAINRADAGMTGFGQVLIRADLGVINAITTYIGAYAVRRSDARRGGSGASDIATLSMLVHELGPEPRYYLLNSIVNQLRFTNAYSRFFSDALLSIFAHDLADPEETEIREQITRVLLERLFGYAPQPWTLRYTIEALVQNENYVFFDLPFIKQSPEAAARFRDMLHQPQTPSQ